MKKNENEFALKADDFGEDFKWGVSTAAYQIEGAYDKHDKKASIWDTFTTKKGKIYSGHHGKIATDFYHNYQQDIDLMQRMNIKNFRFSLSWARLIPDGVGKKSSHGVAFYNKVINYCLQCGITPWVTLYHWDLPQKLQDKGGWTNRSIIQWFQEYAEFCALQFGDRVKNWMVLNEPMVFTGAGYFLGVHAPGKKGMRHFIPAIHHATLCQAVGGRTLRSHVKNAYIGTTFSCSYIQAFSTHKKDILAANRANALLNRLFIEPALGLGYPTEDIAALKRITSYIMPGDDKKVIFNFDFIGVQVYTREIVKYSWWTPYLKAKLVKATDRNVATTLMDWEVYPPSICKMIEQFNAYKGVGDIIITENGSAFTDRVLNEKVYDPKRLSYLQAHLKQLRKAQILGSQVKGYFVWTFTDNFEWAEGYYPRFGLVYVDFKTQKRIIKTSGKWFANFLKSK
ncbi:GH1 family beta-glucosidase [Aquimarina agarivorans]|uniref:GH1 family beta-glucosidase n=1 Tax=Aquimarina agarivorans TaxID=980584 RepID=UPI000248F625|nr:GH1 family beta-glucosidase [Aquimarina agarivorans]